MADLSQRWSRDFGPVAKLWHLTKEPPHLTKRKRYSAEFKVKVALEAIPSQGLGYHAPQSGLVYRHHLHSDAAHSPSGSDRWRLDGSFLYLVAMMDWFSRKVLSWRLSNSMDAGFCIEALKDALAKDGPPEIFNDRAAGLFMRSLDDALMFTDDLPLGHDHQAGGVDVQANRSVGKVGWN